MPGSVSTDTLKLQKIKSTLQQFNAAMQANSRSLINYLSDKKSEVESNFKRRLECFEENERYRQQAEVNADEDALPRIHEENSCQRCQELAELNDLKALIRMFYMVSDELEHRLHKMSGIYSHTLSRGASTLSKCIQIMDEYFAVTFPGANRLKSTPFRTSGSGQNAVGSSPTQQMRDAAGRWVLTLSDQQKEAIHDYTKELPPYYKNINGVLRGYQNTYDSGNQERSEQIHSALGQTSTPCDITVYRGCSNEALGELSYASEEELVGGIFIDKGYASTSLSRDRAFSDDILLEIHLPRGSHAADIESLSAAGGYEEEVLIDRGQVFQITDVYRDETGRRILSVNAIN